MSGQEEKQQNIKEKLDQDSNSVSPFAINSIGKVKDSTPRAKRLFFLTLIIAVVIAVGFGVLRYFDSSPDDQKVITIGDTVITEEDITVYAASMQGYIDQTESSFESVTLTGSEPIEELKGVADTRQLAEEDLVMNAALRYEAKTRDIAVYDYEVDEQLEASYQFHGSKEAYQSAMQQFGIAEVMKIRIENDILKKKLADFLIAKKDLFVVKISYDTPLHFNSEDAGYSLHDDAIKILNDKFKPLFEQQKPREEIAAEVDVDFDDDDHEDDSNPQPYFEQLVTTAEYVPGYSHANPTFSDKDVEAYAAIEGLTNTDEKIKELTDAGQFTEVFPSKAGFHAIIRLESKTEGSYNSWNDFLDEYVDKYARSSGLIKKITSVTTNIVKAALKDTNDILRALDKQVTPRASAQSGNCGNHYANFHVSAWDVTTGQLQRMAVAVTVDYVRPVAGCQPNGHGTYTIPGGSAIAILDNCWNPRPNDFNVVVPEGYKIANVPGSRIGVKTNGNPGKPSDVDIWNSQQINSVQQVPVDIFFVQDKKPFQVQGQRVFHDDSGRPSGAFSNGQGETRADKAPDDEASDSTYGNPGATPFKFANYTSPVRISSSNTINRGGETYILRGYTKCDNSTSCNDVSLSQVTPGSQVLVDLSAVGGYSNIWWHYEKQNPGESLVRVRVRVQGGGGAPTVRMETFTHSMGTCGWEFSVSGSRDCTGTSFGTPDGLRVTDENINSQDYRTLQWNVVSRRLNGYSNTANSSQLSCNNAGCNLKFGGGYGVEIEVLLEPIPDPPSAYGCPRFPNPLVSVSLSRNYTQSAPSGYSSSYGSSSTIRYTTETRYTSREDISSGGSRILPAVQSTSTGNPGRVVLDYRPYIDAYPYDENQARVNYLETYNTEQWRADGSRRSVYRNVYGWRRYYVNPPGPNNAYYEWRWVVVDTEFSHYEWRWRLASRSTSTRNSSVNANRMPACWDRQYDARANIVGRPTLSPDRESPNRSVLTGSINVNFRVPYPSKGRSTVRQNSRVNNINYTIAYRIRRASGAYTGYSIFNSSTNVTASSNSKNNASGSSTLPSRTFNVSVPGVLNVGDSVCWFVSTGSGSRTRGDMNLAGSIIRTDGEHRANEQCSPTVVNWPYFKVFGNDVVSGGRFGSCSVSNGNGIRAFTRNNNAGSSAQYAAFALGTINGFTTASLRTGTPSAPTGLTFANSGVGAFGGRYSGNDGLTCLQDFFDSKPSNTIPISVNNVDALLSTPNDNRRNLEYYEINGNLTLNRGIPVSNGVKKVFYIDGTLTINQNLTFNTTWTERDDVPYVMFIARNVIIRRNVTQLDGVYVAQPTNNGSSDGVISTCDVQSFHACSSPLVINGAFISEDIRLLRTRGSLRDARQREGNPSVPMTSCSHGAPSNVGTPGGATCAAEIFTFSPEVFLGIADVLTPEENFNLDSFTTLPPVL